MMNTTLSIEGMTCNGCAANLQKALLRLSGVSQANVSFEQKNACIVYDPNVVTLEKLVAAVDSAGFDVSPSP